MGTSHFLCWSGGLLLGLKLLLLVGVVAGATDHHEHQDHTGPDRAGAHAAAALPVQTSNHKDANNAHLPYTTPPHILLPGFNARNTARLAAALFAKRIEKRYDMTNQICSSDIKKASNIIDEKKLRVRGPNGCVVPYNSDATETLKGRWVVSAGGSKHWGVAMNLLRMLAPQAYPVNMEQSIHGTSTWNLTTGKGDDVPPIIEVTLRNGEADIRCTSLVDYVCSDSPATRLTVVHEPDINAYTALIKQLRTKCPHYPRANIVADVSGGWYKYCSQKKNWACRHLGTSAKRSRMRYEKDIHVLLSSSAVQRADSVLYLTWAHEWTFFKWSASSHLMELNPTRLKQYGHASNADAMGGAMAILHTLGRSKDPWEEVELIGLGCFSEDALSRGLYMGKTWEKPYWQQCEVRHINNNEHHQHHHQSDYNHNKSNLNNNKSNKSNGRRLIHPPTTNFTLNVSLTHDKYFLSTSKLGDEGRYVQIALAATAVLGFVVFKYLKRQKAVSTSQNQIRGMGTLRMLASLHIVAGHLERYGPGVMTPIALAEFGYTWVPWFLMLSGFVLTWAEQSRKISSQTSWLTFLTKRLLGIYPVYVAGMISTILVGHTTWGSIPYERWCIDLLLMQSWWPGWPERAILPHSWFLSAIVPCWALHGSLLGVVRKTRTRGLMVYGTVLTLLPLIVFGVDCWWCGQHHSGDFHSTMDAILVTLKFHPALYVTSYVSGMCAACLARRLTALESLDMDTRRKRPAERVAQVAADFGVLIGTLGLVLCFGISRATHFHGSVMAFRLGALLPFHALTLIGLAVGSDHDPVRRLFSQPLLDCWGSVSYSQYVFQFVWFHLWYERPLQFCFWIWCVGCSVVVTTLVDQPIRKRQWLRGAIGFVATVAIVGWLNHRSLHEVGTDMRIEGFPSGNWINPSVQWYNGTLQMVARHLEVDGENWISSSGMGKLDWMTGHVHGWVREGTDWDAWCERPNQLIVGVEDPRLLVINDTLTTMSVRYIQSGDDCLARPMLRTLGIPPQASVIVSSDSRRSTKNWMHLERDLFMTNITTQTIVRLNRTSGLTSVVSENPFCPTLNNLHGGSNLIRTISCIDMETPILLGLVHSAYTYENFLIEFEAQPPYALRRLSRKIPLDGGLSRHILFGSGLAPVGNESWILTYGVEDRGSRALVLTRTGCALMFSDDSSIRIRRQL
jgi:peptidoglycan/LPS O-acetylase OafA/YrhL